MNATDVTARTLWANQSEPPAGSTEASPADVIVGRRHYFHLLAAAFAMLTLTLTAIVANTLVIVIFFKHRRLRRCKNVYLVGLSVADLGVGLCMPLALADELLAGWAPRGMVCRLYLVVRDSLLLISLLTIVQVSADRWWSIHRPFNYRVRQSKSMATTLLVVTWVLTFLLQVPVTGFYDVIAALVTSSQNVPPLGELVGQIGGGGDGGSDGVGGDGDGSGIGGVGPEKRGVEEEAGAAAAAYYASCGLVLSGEEGEGVCEVPYRHDVGFVVVVTALRYLVPFLFLLALNVTLYAKIQQRKRIQVRRSISGIDTVLFSLLKVSSSDSECHLQHAEDNNNDLQRLARSDRRHSRLSPAPLSRRHTMSQILFPGYSPAVTVASSPRAPRPLKRRVSLQDCLQSSAGRSSSSYYLQVPRRKSQGLKQSLSDSLLPVPRRQSRDDLAKDMLSKQDKKAACFLGLLQGVLLVCWTPFTVVSIANAATDSTLLPHWASAASLWLLLGNSAVNPFLYALFNQEFGKVVMHWFKIKGSKRDRFKTALRRFSMHIAVELEKNGYGPNTAFETVVE